MSSRGREPKGQQIQVGVRLDVKLVDELEELAERLSTPWVKANLTDAIRAAIAEGIPVLRAKLDAASPSASAPPAPTAPADSTRAARKRPKPRA